MAKVIRTATFFIFIILALPGIASDKQAILFKDSSGQTILKYHKLSVSDAEGRKVPAYMTVADASVAIVADDRYAVYPLIIDPIIEYEKKIIANHFSASDYVNLKNNTNLWMNLQMNMFSNNDTEFTGQFDWRFYQDTLFTQNFTYYLALEGWYTSHSKESLCFYSPSFSDSTLLRIDPQYIFSKYFGIKGKLGIGYSVTEETQPFKYGYSIFGNPTENLSYTAGCTHSNAAKLAAGTTYHYTECEVNLGYKW